MAFEGKVFRILIASPGDVGDERNVIPEIINEWNAINAFNTKFILMPVKWETHSAPLLGDRPQGIINDQIVKDCDMLVGVFWTRIGTNTGIAISGTAEEIEQFVEMDKPVMLYFSQSPIDPEKIEIDQFSTLKTFKEKMRLKGLTESYAGIPDFKQKFSRQLGININHIIVTEQEKNKKDNKKQVGEGKKGEVIGETAKEKKASVPIMQINNELLTPERIDEYLISAVKRVADNEGWAHLSALGVYLNRYTPIDYRDFGFQKLLPFIESRKLFEKRIEQKSPHAKNVDSAYIRLIKK